MNKKEKSNKILLVGYSGAGKTSVGKALAGKVDASFIDMDEHIEKEQGKSPMSIMMMYGEHQYRNYEAELLDTVCEEDSDQMLILSCSAGIILDDLNIEKMKDVNVVFLDAPPDILFSRVKNDENNYNSLPHIKDENIKKAKFTGRYNFRKHLYKSIADLTIDTSVKSPEEIVSEILHYYEETI